MLGLAGSAIAHLAVFALLALALSGPRPPGAPPPMIVSLTRWTPRPIAPAPLKQPPPRRAAATPRRTSAPQAVPPTTARLLPQTLSPSAPIDPGLAAMAGVRAALGASVRCAHADDHGMEEAERARCRQLFRDSGAGGPIYDVDPADHARHEPPVASHGWAAVIGPPPPLPGVPLSAPPNCDHTWCEHPDEHRGP